MNIFQIGIGKSDVEGNYKLVASISQVTKTSATWKEKHNDQSDFPLFGVKKLAFQKQEGLELPLFLEKDDAAGTIDNFQSGKL